MKNIFVDMPEFIDSDIRTARSNNDLTGSYTITNELQYFRHNQGLPNLDGLRVLDLGCCVAATGAWAMAAGASKYVGVEMQTGFVEQARKNLSRYFPNKNWQIIQESFDDFFHSNTETFDIVVAWGVIYQTIYFETLIKNITRVCQGTIVIDSIVPNTPAEIPSIEYREDYKPVTAGSPVSITAALPTLSALTLLLNEQSFILTTNLTNEIRLNFPAGYKQRYFVKFDRVDSTLGNFKIPTTWTFDLTTADNFDKHAKQHIPKYSEVINQSILVCEQRAGSDGKIIDVGCAIGETIKRLHARGFTNLVGVDYSENMLAHARKSAAAEWIHSATFPADHGLFRVVLCNWTLHFIKNKIKYLTDIYNSIENGGALVLTEKTSLEEVDIQLYHQFKRQQGLSQEEIHSKAASVKNIMYIDSPEWYLSTLRSLGFTHVSIINAAPCFTTFLAVK